VVGCGFPEGISPLTTLALITDKFTISEMLYGAASARRAPAWRANSIPLLIHVYAAICYHAVMTNPALIDNIAKNLLAQYPSIVGIISSEKLDKGLANANYVLKTTEGGYFLKIIPPSQYAYIPRQLSFYANIGKSKVQTIQPIKNKAASFLTEINGEKILLFPLEAISEPSVDSGVAASLGSLTANLHNTNVTQHDLEQAYYQKSTCLELLNSLDATLRRKYTKYLPYIESIDDNLPKGFVFDDICTDNLYAKGNEILGFIDPENAGYGEYIFDIAGALVQCFFPHDNKVNLCRSFLEQYEVVRPLTGAEKDNLYESIIMVCVLLSLFFERQPEPKDTQRINRRLGIADGLIELGKKEFGREAFAIYQN
jgi:Ser/Thr protein kinase RdoA (MazF antagonist)